MKSKKYKKYLKRFCKVFLFLCTIFIVFVIFIEEIFEFDPPKIQNKDEIIRTLPKQVKKKNVILLKNCWVKEEQGLRIVFLKGKPFIRGWIAGKITGQYVDKQEEVLLNRVKEIIKSRTTLWGLRKIGYILSRDLPSRFPLYMQKEVYGFSCAIKNKHPELGSSYFRSLNYQAAHDIGHFVAERILAHNGCTSFAVWGKATHKGDLFLGRNFDFEIGDFFDTFKLVQVIFPIKGIPFISVSWPGMSGVVTGVNQKKLAVTINAAKTDHYRWKGTPVTVITRRILQEASTIKEAISILKQEHSFISESFLLADGKTGRAVIVEKSPKLTVLRYPKHFKDGLVCANHFLDSAFKNHKARKIFIKEGSSPRRLKRARELIQKHYGFIDENIVARMLRDKKLPGNKECGNGHMHTINPSICSHSVIMNLTKGILWISLGPNQSNKYIPININTIFSASYKSTCVIGDKIIDIDTLFPPREVKILKQWNTLLLLWQKKGAKMTISSLKKLVEKMEKLNAEHFFSFLAKGDYFKRCGDVKRARIYWKYALERFPYGDWKEKIEQRLRNNR